MDASVGAKDLGLLVVGTGWLGTRRAAAAVAAKGIRLVAVFDVDDASSLRVAEHHGVLAVPDLATGLLMPGVDAVVIATPHADHARAARKAIDAGKHVLCEKPLTIDPHEARMLAQRADDRGVRLATGLNHRFYPPVADALRLVEAHRIGEVESVRVEIGHNANEAFLTSWHVDVERSGGGTLMDNGPHACDLIRKFAGEIIAAKGYVTDTIGLPEGCESEAFAIFRNHDRAIAELRSSWTLKTGYLTIEVRGREGFLRVETAPWRLSGCLAGGHRIDRHYVGARCAEAFGRWMNGCEQSLVQELEAFASSDQTHPRRGATGWDGCRATEMIHAVYRSAETGEEVLLDPLPVRLPSARKHAKAPEAA